MTIIGQPRDVIIKACLAVCDELNEHEYSAAEVPIFEVYCGGFVIGITCGAWGSVWDTEDDNEGTSKQDDNGDWIDNEQWCSVDSIRNHVLTNLMHKRMWIEEATDFLGQRVVALAEEKLKAQAG